MERLIRERLHQREQGAAGMFDFGDRVSGPVIDEIEKKSLP